MNSTIYTEADYLTIKKQLRQRWMLLGIPCALLTVAVVISLIIRLQWLTCAATILIGALLIAGYDLTIKPLRSYEQHLHHCLYGRNRECELPFIALSENVDLVEGVRCRQLLCEDEDGKGRPYERLFYFDAEKPFPTVAKGTILHIVHHELTIANVYPV